MKALLMDAGLVLLIALGTIGGEAPTFLAESLGTELSDLNLPEAKPRYTPIPAERKAPALKPIEVAEQASFDSPLLTPAKPVSNIAPAYTPAGTNTNVPISPISSPVESQPSYQPVPYQSYQPPVVESFSSPAPSVQMAPPTLNGVPSPAGPGANAPLQVIGPPEPGYAYRPLVPVVSQPPTVHLGRGIIGQPTVYIPGQPVRNFLRYFSP